MTNEEIEKLIGGYFDTERDREAARGLLHDFKRRIEAETSAEKATTPFVQDSKCNYIASRGSICRKCGSLHDGNPNPSLPFQFIGGEPSGRNAAGPAAGKVLEWPKPPARRQSATLFDDGYEEGWAKCINTLKEMGFSPPATSAPEEGKDVADAKRRYQWICTLKCSSLSISRDEDHASNYTTASDWIDNVMPELFDGVDPDELQRMRDTNTIWSVQVYPDTPVGSYVAHGATLDAAIDAAMAKGRQS